MPDGLTTDAEIRHRSRPAKTPSLAFSSIGVPVVLALLVVYVVWGSTYLAIRYVVAGLPPFLAAGVRFFVAGVVLYAWAIRRGGSEQRLVDRPTRTHWRSAFIIGGMLLAIGNGSVSAAERYVPSGIAALLVAMSPLWMALFGWLHYRERLTSVGVVGLLVGFGGVALLVGGRSGQVRAAGVGWLLGATLAWAIGSLYARTAPMPQRPLVGTAMEMIAGGLACVAAGAASGEFSRIELSQVRVSSWLGLAYLIVFGSLFAYSAYAWLLRNAPTPLVSTYAYVNPVIAVVLGSLIAGERLTVRTGVAAAVIVIGVALIVSGPRFGRRHE